jgi:transposase-like protein
MDVDDAVERWHQTETVESAARRLGLCGETLRRRLKSAGHGAARKSNKQHIRVTVDDLRKIGVAA